MALFGKREEPVPEEITEESVDSTPTGEVSTVTLPTFVVRDDTTPSVDNSTPNSPVEHLNWNLIGVGVDSDGREVRWNAKTSPTLIAVGVKGSGKATLAKTIIKHCLNPETSCAVFGADPEGILFPQCQASERITVLEDVEAVEDCMVQVKEIMAERYEEMTASSVTHFTQLATPAVPILIIITDSVFRIESVAVDLVEFMRVGKAVGIYVAVFAESLSRLPAGILNSSGTRVAMHGVSDEDVHTLFGVAPSEELLSSLHDPVAGRALLDSGSRLIAVQLYAEVIEQAAEGAPSLTDELASLAQAAALAELTESGDALYRSEVIIGFDDVEVDKTPVDTEGLSFFEVEQEDEPNYPMTSSIPVFETADETSLNDREETEPELEFVETEEVKDLDSTYVDEEAPLASKEVDTENIDAAEFASEDIQSSQTERHEDIVPLTPPDYDEPRVITMLEPPVFDEYDYQEEAELVQETEYADTSAEVDSEKGNGGMKLEEAIALLEDYAVEEKRIEAEHHEEEVEHPLDVDPDESAA